MKRLLTGLAAALLLSFSFGAAAAEGMSPVERILAMDCDNAAHPDRCKAVQNAEKTCKDKPTREEQKACVREILKSQGIIKQ